MGQCRVCASLLGVGCGHDPSTPTAATGSVHRPSRVWQLESKADQLAYARQQGTPYLASKCCTALVCCTGEQDPYTLCFAHLDESGHPAKPQSGDSSQQQGGKAEQVAGRAPGASPHRACERGHHEQEVVEEVEGVGDGALSPDPLVELTAPLRGCVRAWLSGIDGARGPGRVHQSVLVNDRRADKNSNALLLPGLQAPFQSDGHGVMGMEVCRCCMQQRASLKSLLIEREGLQSGAAVLSGAVVGVCVRVGWLLTVRRTKN